MRTLVVMLSWLIVLASVVGLACEPTDDDDAADQNPTPNPDDDDDDNDNDDNDNDDNDDDNDNNDTDDDDDDDNDNDNNNDDDNNDDNDTTDDDSVDDDDEVLPLTQALYEHVDGGEFVFGQPLSLTLDPAGEPHFASYKGMGLFLYDLDEPPEAFPAPVLTGVMAVGPDGTRHVVYQGIFGLALYYAVETAPGVWDVTRLVLTEGRATEDVRLVIDNQGYAHVAAVLDPYGKGTAGPFYTLYLTNRTGTWTVEELFPEIPITDIRLTVDEDGYAHLLVVEDYMFVLVAGYATNRSGAWSVVPIDSCQAFMIAYCTMYPGDVRVDSAGKAHLSYSMIENTEFGYGDIYLHHFVAQMPPMTEEVGELEFVYASAMALDSADHVVMLADNGDLYFATNAGGEWATEPVGAGGGWGLCMAVDADDSVHSAYPGVGLTYLENTSGNWVEAILDTGRRVGERSAIALDTAGHTYIAYFDEGLPGVRFAHNVSGAWQTEVVETTPVAAGSFPPIALQVDAAGAAHVVYPASAAVQYATNAGGGWVVEAVAPANAVDVDLALDNSGQPHIVFTGLVSGDVTYARRVDKAWVVETVDDGRRAALSVDSDGAVHVGYVRQDGQNPGALHYAVRVGGNWTTELVHAGTEILSYTDVDIALHPDGYARLAGTTISNDYGMDPYVFYAQDMAAGWLVEPVPGTVGGWDQHDWCSLAVDAAGNAHLSFQFEYEPDARAAEAEDYDYSQARYVENTTGEWRAWVLTPEPRYEDPVPSSLTVSPQGGVAHVALSYEGALWHVVIDDPARRGR